MNQWSYRIISRAGLGALTAFLVACGGGGGSGSNGPHNHDADSGTNRDSSDAKPYMEFKAVPKQFAEDPLFRNAYPIGINHWDEDGIQNVSDNCPIVTNPNQEPASTHYPELQKYGAACVVDTDGDSMADKLDFDGDGIPDDEDNIPWQFNPLQADINANGIGDDIDPDIDSDRIPNEEDNCPYVYNPDQAASPVKQLGGAGVRCVVDADGDGVADAFDTDGDGVPDAYAVPELANQYPVDNCPFVPNNPKQKENLSLKDIEQLDRDGDSIGDACDLYPDIPVEQEEIDQALSGLRGQKTCNFGYAQGDLCLSHEAYLEQRRALADREAASQGLAAFCAVEGGEDYKDARSLLGGKRYYDIKWWAPFGNIAPHLSNIEGALDDDATSYATFSLPFQLLAELTEILRHGANLVTGTVNVLVRIITFGTVKEAIPQIKAVWPTVQIYRKDGLPFNEQYTSATVFLSGNWALGDVGGTGGWLRMIDRDSNGKVVAASAWGGKIGVNLDPIRLAGGDSLFPITVSASAPFNGVEISIPRSLVGKSVKIHTVCLQ